MKKDKNILIAGAGPTGLSLAIFLSEKGYSPRIIDKKPVISEYSKALGVNPRTMEILDEFNLSKRFLDNGRKMPAMNVWANDKHIFRNDFSKAKHKYPFLIIQPQKESEEILLEELSRRKIKVEYATELISFEQNENGYKSKIVHADEEYFNSDFLIAADGAHSVTRKQLNIEFKGFRYKNTWELYDVELEMEVNSDEAHIRVFDKGGMIMIRIRENLWRIAGNLNGLLNYLPKKTKVGKIKWESKFNINHNVAASLVHNNIVLIGDAAHIHSPIGGRGMNLGVEDAYIVSKLIDSGRIHEYDKLRRSYLMRTVKRIDTISSNMAADTTFAKFVRKNAGMFRPFFPLGAHFLRNFALGLDRKRDVF